MLQVFIFSLLVMVASLVGVITVWGKLGKAMEKNLGFLVSFSAGVFLIVAYQLGKETLEHAESIEQGLFWIFAGALFIFLLFELLPDFHKHDTGNGHHKHGHSKKIDARRMLTGDAIHNMGDGILLAAAFSVSPALGMLTAVSVFIHELAQEISEFFVLKQAGYSTKGALAINFAISSTILIGSLGGFLLLGLFEVFEVPLLGIASGSFLIVVFHDLIPHSVRESGATKHYLQHIFWFAVGVLLMLSVNSIIPHGHDDAHDHDHNEGDVHEHYEDGHDDHHEDEHDHHEEEVTSS